MNKAAIELTILALIGLIMIPTEASAQITHPSPSYEYAPLTPRVGDTVTFDASDLSRTGLNQSLFLLTGILPMEQPKVEQSLNTLLLKRENIGLN